MEIDNFLKKLQEITEKSKENPDPMVRQATAVLFALQGAIYAGPNFLAPFTDEVMVIAKNQRDILQGILNGTR